MSDWKKLIDEEVRVEHRDKIFEKAEAQLDRNRPGRRRFLIGSFSLAATAAVALFIKAKIDEENNPPIEAAALRADLMNELNLVDELEFFEDLEDAETWEQS